MRILNRIFFALLAAIGLYLVIDFTNESVVNEYVNEKGQEAIDAGDFDFFVSARYYNKNLILEDVFITDNYTFSIKIYNVANIRQVGDTYEVIEGFQIILHQTQGVDLEPPFNGNIISATSDIDVQYLGIKISELPLYTFALGNPRSTFFNKNLFINEDIFDQPARLELSYGSIEIGSYDFTIDYTDFRLEEWLMTYIEVHGVLPTNGFDDVGYSSIIQIDSSSLVIRNSIIYIVITTIITILLFFVSKKKMGRKKATEGLTKDIQKVQSEHQEKR
jgi:hypothetical protein